MRIVRRPLVTQTLNGLHPVLARVYAARGIGGADELRHDLNLLLPPQLKGVDAAVELLIEALAARWHIAIVADFDADGATSCALVVRALRAMGAAQVSYLVPNRFEFGYGLTPAIVDVAARLRPRLLITVDNGIASVDGVAHARALGLRVLITDHHLPGKVLPAADAILNPNQTGCDFPSKHLAGVGVAFYLMVALRTQLRARGWFNAARPEPTLAALLDLVALGTIADVVRLDRNNRVLVAQGLARINADRACAGIKALLKVAGRAPGRLTAADLAYCAAPRLNAAGRLDDMRLGIDCLLADDIEVARRAAMQLDALNRERREIEADMQAQADAALTDLRLNGAALPRGLALFDERWHQGVIGILAGRVREAHHRPVIAFAAAGDALLKGSARSIPSVHIRDVLDAVATKHPGLIDKFGGHAQAAGLSLARANFAAFARAFDAEVAHWLNGAALDGEIETDGALAPAELCLATAEALDAAGPWGQGFPEPCFDGEFAVVDRRVVGERHVKFVLRGEDSHTTFEAMAFRAAPLPGWRECARLEAAYRLAVNEYEGLRSLNLILQHWRPLVA